MEAPAFAVGQRWVSHTDAALGLGIVTEVAGRTVTLGFPASDEERTYAIDSAINPLITIAIQRQMPRSTITARTVPAK